MIVRHPWRVLIVVLGLTFALLPQLRYSWMDLSTEAYLPKDDSSLADYNAFRDQFGNGSHGIITIEAETEFFTLENLQRLKALHEELEAQVPHVEKIDSLVTMRLTRGVGDELQVDDLIEHWPQSEKEMPAFRQMVLNNPTYAGNIVSENGRLTSLILKPDSYSAEALLKLEEAGLDSITAGFDDEEENIGEQGLSKEDYLKPEEEAAFAQAMLDIGAAHNVPGFKVHVSGTPVVNYKLAVDLGNAMMRDMAIGIVVIAILLGLLFRRVSGVLMPLLAVWLSLMATMALMPALGIAFTASTQILPTFLLAVGIADAVHILSIFYRRYDAGEEKQAAISGAMKQTAVAIIMTTVTTAAGLLSFAGADFIPTRMLGIFAAVGVVLALVYTTVLMPALLAVLPVKRKPLQTSNRGFLALIDQTIIALGEFGVRHAKPVLVATIAIVVFSIVGIGKVEFSHDPVRWNPEGHPLRVATELIDSEMSGTQNMQVIFDTGVENGLHNPQMLQLVEDAEAYIAETEIRGVQANKSLSVLNVVKEIHQALNGDDENFYVIPDNQQVISQELLLFENSGVDDLEELVDSTFQQGRVAVVLPWSNVIGYQDYIETVNNGLDDLIAQSGLDNVTVKVTGILVIFAKTLHVMLEATVDSYILAFSFVGLLMFVLMGNLRRGMLAFVPNVIPIVLTVGMMGWFGIPLNLLTSMVGCIIIGISVDDTIHFMHHYRQHAQNHDAIVAVDKTLETVGRAITFTSIVLVGGFMVHVLDQFLTSRHFGILLSVSVALALFANLVVAPALLTLFWQREQQES